MQAEELRALVQDIQHQKTEKQTVELKAGNGGFPRSMNIILIMLDSLQCMG